MGHGRVTQQDVAREAGVHRTTVSLALKNHPGIPPETGDRVRRIAARLGYAPDPVLTALTAYRNRQRPRAFHGTLAWLTNSSNGFEWESSLHYRLYHAGAAARAQFHGYRLEVVDQARPQVSTRRLLSILRARNVSGILLCPQPNGNIDLSFPWERFSVVAFGHSLKALRLHTVSSMHYSHTQQAMREVVRRGYRRPGLVINQNDDVRSDHNIYASYLVEHTLAFGDQPPPRPYFRFEQEPWGLAGWVREQRVDAIVTNNHAHVFNQLSKDGVAVPRDVALVNVTLPTANPVLTGVVENDEMIGAQATDTLVAMIQRSQRGSPGALVRTYIEGVWNEGATLPPASRAE